MKLENQCCSLIQAKRLKELGIKQESVWSWYETVDVDDTPRLNLSNENAIFLPKQQWEEKYAAFAVAELGVMLRDWINKSPVSVPSGAWAIMMFRRSDNINLVGDHPTESSARAAMLIYLLENNLITPEEVNTKLLQS